MLFIFTYIKFFAHLKPALPAMCENMYCAHMSRFTVIFCPDLAFEIIKNCSNITPAPPNKSKWQGLGEEDQKVV